MEIKEALEFADKLIFAQTGKHLNDLEREVFQGSWQDRTYEEIYPLNPQYVEKDVGYKLWKKLSKVLGEKVTKKNFRGALERALLSELPQLGENLSQSGRKGKRVFISYRNQEPDARLAAQFYEAISGCGHQVFISALGGKGEGPPQVGKDWISHLDAQLQQCDYFLLLLSPKAAASEMTIEELRRVKELRCSHQKPIVLPIRVNCPFSIPLNHDLRNYLDGMRQRQWNSPADTPNLVQEVLKILAEESLGQYYLDKTDLTPPTTLSDKENRKSDSPILQEEGLLERYPLQYWDGGVAEGELPPSQLAPSLPLPVAEPELPSGQVRLASAFYVERVPQEALCYKEILQPGALIRIKAPRQMGKTSLMARILYQAKEHGYRTVPLSFQHADTVVFANLNELLRWFCARIARKLRLTHQVDDYWSDTFGSKDNCTAYFEDFLLSASEEPLVLGLDEVDRVFQYPKIADDFFGLLRAWYEEAGYGDGDSDLWQKLRLVVVHSTEVYVPLNVNQSPFNVGLPIELPDFSPAQVQDLTQRHGLNWNISQVGQLMQLVGGHPYLVRLALYHIAQQTIALDRLLKTAPTEAGLYDDHLRRHLWNLQQHPELAAAFGKVVTADVPVELESLQAFKLHSMGLVKLQGNYVTPRCNLYRLYFSDRLGKM